MMFDDIIQNEELFGLIRGVCEERDICIEFSNDLTEDKYIILKVDAYYSSSRMHNPPPAIDCLIIVKCDFNPGYDFYLAELRDIKSPKGFNVENIKAKFTTTIEDFLITRFADIFLNPDYPINGLKLCFVSDACRIKKKFPDVTQAEYRKKIMGTKYDVFSSLKPFEFRGKKGVINPLLPNPIIKAC